MVTVSVVVQNCLTIMDCLGYDGITVKSNGISQRVDIVFCYVSNVCNPGLRHGRRESRK